MTTRNNNRTPVPAEIRATLEQLIDYLWDDERSDFENRSSNDRGGHIFEALQELQRWLNDSVTQSGFIRQAASVRGEGWSL